MPRHHIAAALLLVFSVAGVRPADACKCAKPDLAKEVQGATAVFVGKPISATKRPVDPAECAKPAPNLCRYEYTHEVQVEGVWKGDVPATVTIDAGSGGGDCTFGDLGQEQWLFVTGPDFAVHRCGATQLATKEVLHQVKKQLGPPKPVKPAKAAKPDAPKAPATPKAGKP